MSARATNEFGSPRTRAVISITVGLLCAPVLLDLASSLRVRPFGYVAADTFYYLSVARNIARHGVPSFDGRFEMNGFHPLWQLVLAFVYAALEIFGQVEGCLLVTVLVSLAFVAAAVVCLGIALQGKARRLSAAFALLPVGVYGLVVAPFYAVRFAELPSLNPWEGSMPVYGTLWSFVNGVESGPVLFFFALSAVLYRRASNPDPAVSTPEAATWLGSSLALMALSRLDHALISLSVLSSFVIGARLREDRRRLVLRASFAFAAPFALYLLYNQLTFGNPIPISGLAKSTFPFFTSEHLASLLGLWDQPFRQKNLLSLYREAAIAIPALVALAYVPLVLRGESTDAGYLISFRPSALPIERFLFGTAIGVLSLAAYNGLFVPASQQGHWYFPVSTLFVTLVPLCLWARTGREVPVRVTAPLMAVWVVGALVFFMTLHRHVDYHANYAAFYFRQAPRIRQYYAGRSPHFIECDDGIVNYSLDLPTMSCNLALDVEGALAKREGRLFRLAKSRGFDRLVTLVYQPQFPLPPDATPEQGMAWASNLLHEDLKGFAFTIDYRDPVTGFSILKAAGGFP